VSNRPANIAMSHICCRRFVSVRIAVVASVFGYLVIAVQGSEACQMQRQFDYDTWRLTPDRVTVNDFATGIFWHIEDVYPSGDPTANDSLRGSIDFRIDDGPTLTEDVSQPANVTPAREWQITGLSSGFHRFRMELYDGGPHVPIAFTFCVKIPGHNQVLRWLQVTSLY